MHASLRTADDWVAAAESGAARVSRSVDRKDATADYCPNVSAATGINRHLVLSETGS